MLNNYYKYTNLLFFVIFLLAPALLFADIIVLKNGKSLSGKIIGQTRTAIRIKTKAGRKTIGKKTIRSVKFGVTRDEKAVQAVRRKEIIRRKAQLAVARKKNQAVVIAKEQKRLADLKKQEKQEAEDLKQRQKVVLSAEEQVVRLNTEEADLEKKLLELRKKRAKLEGKNYNENPYGALWRSALVPGWGQIHKGSTYKGIAFMGITALLAGNLVSQNAAYNDAVSTYDTNSSLGLLFSQASPTLGQLLSIQALNDASTVDSKAKSATYAAAGLGIFYLYNLFDAWFFDGPTLEAGLQPHSIRDGWDFITGSDYYVNRHSFVSFNKPATNMTLKYSWKF